MPVAAISPKSTQNSPAKSGGGIAASKAPNLGDTPPRKSSHRPAARETLREATLVIAIAARFSL